VIGLPSLVPYIVLAIVGAFAGGYVKGCTDGSERYDALEGKLLRETDRVRVVTKVIEKEVVKEKQAAITFYEGWTHEVKLEMAAAPVMPSVCDLPTGVLNRGIDRANCAGRLHEAACAAYATPGPDGDAERTAGVDSGEPPGDRSNPD
jgi:hypothetical protein